MNFKSKTKEEIQDEKLAPEGVYPFVVTKATDKASKKEQARASAEGRNSSKDMIELELDVRTNGKTRKMRDWLGSWSGGEEKIMSFCDATGKADKYGNGTLEADDCSGARGYVRVGKQTSDQYGPQNTIKLYVREEDAQVLNERIQGNGAKLESAPAAGAPAAGASDDDVPF